MGRRAAEIGRSAAAAAGGEKGRVEERGKGFSVQSVSTRNYDLPNLPMPKVLLSISDKGKCGILGEEKSSILFLKKKKLVFLLK